MGNRSDRNQTLSDYDTLILSQQTQLPPHILQQLYEAFMERAGRDGRMTISDFKRAYTEINPNANIYNLDEDAERIFIMFDMDRNGVLTFNEFMLAYILLQRGGDVPALRWQYAMNSMPISVLSRPGLLNAAEALLLLQYMNQFYQIPNFDPIMQHNFIWDQLAPQMDPNGYVPQAEYLRLLSAQPHIQPYIW
ncbi:unnamed protein product [Rotaria sordida]|uniref:EF-hand domain-containing protein n=1 Tax=Rotaria sordida TaxID=392033 RepID=A0A815I1L5_9BILA|nr:unnamed protein product [Rotaria sordida]CAF1471282.1 unnamed protein product [Rotaria sordida]CAF1645069.1 unnamed protein product [Rotaria sordida]CAF3720936.1 unnamed protein product [Rotaria sordida]